MEGSVYERWKAWLAQPFSETMNVWGWVLFLGLTIVITYLWTRVLRSVSEAVT